MNITHLGNGRRKTSRNKSGGIETLARTVRDIPTDTASARAYLRRAIADARTRFVQSSTPGSAFDNLALQLHAEGLIVDCATAIREFLYEGGSMMEVNALLLSLVSGEPLEKSNEASFFG